MMIWILLTLLKLAFQMDGYAVDMDALEVCQQLRQGPAITQSVARSLCCHLVIGFRAALGMTNLKRLLR